MKWKALIVACLLMTIILLLPPQPGLPISGQMALGILAFAVVIWTTEAMSYPLGGIFILFFITILLSFGPSLNNPESFMGTKEALKLALSGFSNPAVTMVVGALFLVSAMKTTKLDRRIALWILSKVGSNIHSILLGIIFVGVVLSFLIPSPTARVGAMIPIILGMASAFNLPKNTKVIAILLITSAQISSIWGVGIKTGAPQNIIGLTLIEESFSYSITWGQWFIAAAPWSIFMTIVLYFMALFSLKNELVRIPKGKKVIENELKELGPLNGSQVRLLIIMIGLLFLWSTEKTFHTLDSTTIIIIGLSLLFFPLFGVLSWDHIKKDISWGPILLFASGISLGTVLLKTFAAAWLADSLFTSLHLDTMSEEIVIAILIVFMIVLHLGFASATSLVATLIPVVIALVEEMTLPNGMGVVLITQFAMSFGFILPINAPQNLLSYGTGAFRQLDFIKNGLALTFFGYLFLMFLSMTYWNWIGLL
ncbi:DASS family sodium-coupled anion symporter [Bacillaceae bacterium S4-13-56]